MFYRPEDGHGLSHNPFNAIVSPRPIGWISTRGSTGDNLAPYSFFNAIAYVPPQVMFSSTGGKSDLPEGKDSLANIRETGVFCVNVVSTALIDAMNVTSATLPAGEDEFLRAGLEKAECETIDCPRVAAAPASLECQTLDIIPLKGGVNTMVIGEVTGVHIANGALVNGRFDVTTFQPLARLGYRDYTRVTDVFELTRPDD